MTKKEKKTNGLKTKLWRNVTGCREGTEQAVRADQLLLLLSVPALSLSFSQFHPTLFLFPSGRMTNVKAAPALI